MVQKQDLFPPVKMFGNLYFVGTKPASTHIVDTGEGLIVFDTGYQHSLYVVIDNIYRMGLKVENIKYIFLTHGHIDHLGGARALRDLSGAKIALGKADRLYANGQLDLSYAKELNMSFKETFEPDILLEDGDEITLGNTTVRAVATPGHTPGAMSFFFDVTDGKETFRAGLHGGMGINTMCKEFLDKYNLPYSLRDDFVKSMYRLNEEKVDIFLGNHMQHNKTESKAKLLQEGNKYAYVDASEWQPYNLWCIENLNAMIARENAEGK
jgi:metallo-beta-lactamase class B